MDHKIVCWGDYAVPVAESMNWIAWDENGAVWAYECEPKHDNSVYTGAHIDTTGDVQIVSARGRVPPPEPGSWKTQLYWIGD